MKRTEGQRRPNGQEFAPVRSGPSRTAGPVRASIVEETRRRDGGSLSTGKAAVTGDREALLEQWMQEYGTRILHLAFFYLKDRQLAEDVTQEVFLKAYQSMDEFRGESAVYTWLYRIAVNLCRDRLRSPWWRRIFLPGELPVVRGGEAPDEAALEAVRNQEILRHVLSLPLPYREIVMFYYYEDLSTSEIAQITGLPENTVKTRLHRARKQLKEILSREGVTA